MKKAFKLKYFRLLKKYSYVEYILRVWINLVDVT